MKLRKCLDPSARNVSRFTRYPLADDSPFSRPYAIVLGRKKRENSRHPTESFPHGRTRNRPSKNLRCSDSGIRRCWRDGGPCPDYPWPASASTRSRQETLHRAGIALDGVALRQCLSGRASAGSPWSHIQRIHHPQASVWTGI